MFYHKRRKKCSSPNSGIENILRAYWNRKTIVFEFWLALIMRNYITLDPNLPSLTLEALTSLRTHTVATVSFDKSANELIRNEIDKWTLDERVCASGFKRENSSSMLPIHKSACIADEHTLVLSRLTENLAIHLRGAWIKLIEDQQLNTSANPATHPFPNPIFFYWKMIAVLLEWRPAGRNIFINFWRENWIESLLLAYRWKVNAIFHSFQRSSWHLPRQSDWLINWKVLNVVETGSGSIVRIARSGVLMRRNCIALSQQKMMVSLPNISDRKCQFNPVYIELEWLLIYSRSSVDYLFLVYLLADEPVWTNSGHIQTIIISQTCVIRLQRSK